MRRFCFASGLFVALLWASGCGPSQADKKGAAPAAKVSGTVKIDGKPVPMGEVHFGVEGYSPMGIEITDGKYAGEAPVGKNEVQVFIFVEGPPVARYGGKRLKSNTAPQKYWGPKTVLSATVSAEGPNEFDFNLTSK
jgi:hypothetical protein